MSSMMIDATEKYGLKKDGQGKKVREQSVITGTLKEPKRASKKI